MAELIRVTYTDDGSEFVSWFRDEHPEGAHPVVVALESLPYVESVEFVVVVRDDGTVDGG
jgi:hypothetical protein